MTKYILVMFAMLFVCVSSASAQGTPDWSTPAQETVCDHEPTPGRGLCIAYCEAMDCDSNPNANQNACANVKAKWQNKTGGDDLPCEMSCPCNDIPEYVALSSAMVEATFCFYDPDVPTITLFDEITGTRAAAADSRFGQVCAGGTVFMSITVEEALFCIDELLAAADSYGLDCGDPVL